MQEIDQRFREWELVGDEWRDTGDLVVVLGQVRLRRKEGGGAFGEPGGWLFEFKDDTLFRLRPFVHPEEALEAAELE